MTAVESQWLMFRKVYIVKVNSFWSRNRNPTECFVNILLCLYLWVLVWLITLTAIFLISNNVILFNSPFLVFPSASPLSVVPASVTDSPFSKMQFVDEGLVSADDSQTFTTAEVQLLVWCKGGAIHAVTTGRGTRSRTVQVTERWPEFYIFPYLTYASNFWNANERAILLYRSKHIYALFPLSLKAKTQRGPPDCHCISAIPAELGKNTEIVIKKFKCTNRFVTELTVL